MEVIREGTPNLPGRGILNLVLVVAPAFPGFKKKCNSRPHPKAIIKWVWPQLTEHINPQKFPIRKNLANLPKVGADGIRLTRPERIQVGPSNTKQGNVVRPKTIKRISSFKSSEVAKVALEGTHQVVPIPRRLKAELVARCEEIFPINVLAPHNEEVVSNRCSIATTAPRHPAGLESSLRHAKIAAEDPCRSVHLF
jgi:hypothetical protein